MARQSRSENGVATLAFAGHPIKNALPNDRDHRDKPGDDRPFFVQGQANLNVQ